MSDDTKHPKELEINANVIIIPKPRFYAIVACTILGILFLWNQASIFGTVDMLAGNYCQSRYAEIKLPPPVAVPPVVVPYTPTLPPTNLAKIRDLRRFYLSATENDGKIVLRTGGSISWRFNNPGKMLISDFSKQMGSIGSDGVTAIFPSYEIGRKAMYAYLFTPASKFHAFKIGDVFPADTLKIILDETGISKDATLDSLSEDDRNKLMDSIQKAEGYIEGKVTVFDNEEDFKKRGW